jgi:integrase
VVSFATKEEADEYAAAARRETSGRTVSAAVDAHLQAMRDRGLAGSTVERAEIHLEQLLQLERFGPRAITVLKPKLAKRLYAEHQVGKAVDNHRNGLSAAKSLGAWLVEQGWLQRNPFEAVKGVGRRKHGKPQLMLDEARRLLDYCVANPTPGAIAAACYLLMAVRVSELMACNVRNVDDGGRRLVIERGKTDNARRLLEVPEVLQPLIAGLIAGRGGDRPLFTSRSGERRDRTWAWRAVRDTARAAGVAHVSQHGLRGTHSTAARIAVQTPAAVAAALGHGSTVVQDRSYVDQAELAAAEARRSWRVLAGGKG